MATLTIRIPDALRDRLAAMAAWRGLSMSKLIEEISSRALAERDTEMRFRMRAARGDPAPGLKVLDELDRPHSIADGSRQLFGRYRVGNESTMARLRAICWNLTTRPSQ